MKESEKQKGQGRKHPGKSGGHALSLLGHKPVAVFPSFFIVYLSQKHTLQREAAGPARQVLTMASPV